MENLDKYVTNGIERLFRGTSYQPLYQPNYPRNCFNKFLEKCNILAAKINQKIKKQNEGCT